MKNRKIWGVGGVGEKGAEKQETREFERAFIRTGVHD